MNERTVTASTASAPYGPLEPGLRDPVLGSQTCFRAVLDALAHPGRIVDLPQALAGSPPATLCEATASIVLTMCDIDTPLWLDPAASPAAPYFAFHCGAPLIEGPAKASFAIVSNPTALPPLQSFALGTDEYPEQSATLIIEVTDLSALHGVVLRGPGILDEARLSASGLPTRFWEERQALAELFPRGIDVLFTCGGRVAALPRSTRIG
jgi:alpha-D-ribose 1-methylphosphonate 5-triphosphate synthase subunit PhnH